MEHATYQTRRGEIEHYFDRTAAEALVARAHGPNAAGGPASVMRVLVDDVDRLDRAGGVQRDSAGADDRTTGLNGEDRDRDALFATDSSDFVDELSDEVGSVGR